MKTFRSLLALLPFLLLLAACEGDVEPDAVDTMQDATDGTTAVDATAATMEADHRHQQPDAAGTVVDAVMENGVQVVQVEAAMTGFTPARVRLAADVPARLVFTRTDESACLEQVQIPDYGIDPVDLPLNEAVAIEFTPRDAGTFSFVCGMEMQTGTVVVQS